MTNTIPLLSLLWLLAVPPAPQLRVTPSVGHAPLEVRVSVRIAPQEHDRTIELVALLTSSDPAMVVRRSEVQVRHDGVSHQHVVQRWRFDDAGPHIVIACVAGTQGRARCSEARVEVAGTGRP